MHTCLLLISMLWHRQAIYESKGTKSSSSVECRIRTWKSQNTCSPSDWIPTHKPTELSRIKQKLELNSPSLWWGSVQPTSLHFTVVLLSHLALAIYVFVIVKHTYLPTYLPAHLRTYLPTYIHTCIPTYLHTYIHACCCQFRCSGTGKRFPNRKETHCLPLLNAVQDSKPEGLWNRISSKLNNQWQTDWAIEDQA